MCEKAIDMRWKENKPGKDEKNRKHVKQFFGKLKSKELLTFSARPCFKMILNMMFFLPFDLILVTASKLHTVFKPLMDDASFLEPFNDVCMSYILHQIPNNYLLCVCNINVLKKKKFKE